MAACVKKMCTCEHPSQDKLYGKKIRVHNAYVKKGSNSVSYRCTVCGKES